MNDNIEKEYFGSIFEDNVQLSGDLVLNIDICGESLLRFDVLSSTLNGKPTYASKTYCLKAENGFSGLFDLLDDFFQKRIRFFNSSRSVQRFLIALNDAERKFMERTGRSFLDYYSDITKHAVDTIHLDDSFSNPMTEYLSAGYGIEKESKKSYNVKASIISQIDHSEDIVLNLIESLRNPNEGAHVGNFICINTTDEDEQMFFMEPLINMPMLFYYFDFAMLYIHNLVIPYAKHKAFGFGNNPKVEIYGLKNSITLNELLSICGDYGEVLTDRGYKSEILNVEVTKIEYSDDFIEGKMLSSIIAH
jgi:hypothetical protein